MRSARYVISLKRGVSAANWKELAKSIPGVLVIGSMDLQTLTVEVTIGSIDLFWRRLDGICNIEKEIYTRHDI